VKGQKAKGLRSPESRFANGIEAVLNQMGAQGWEYLRAELLPSEERQGLTGSTTNWRNLLVFRRERSDGARPVVGPAPAVEEQHNAPALGSPAPVPAAEETHTAPALGSPVPVPVDGARALVASLRKRDDDSDREPDQPEDAPDTAQGDSATEENRRREPPAL